MKRLLTAVLRRLRLLSSANRVYYLVHRMRDFSHNRRFVRAHQHFATPPPALAYEAYGHTCWEEYLRTGESHARFIAALIREQVTPRRPLRVLDWGCGAGRIIRHLRSADLQDIELTGVDVDDRATEWCGRHIDGITFEHSPAFPPLAFDAGAFSVVYTYSVITHLSVPTIQAWLAEIARILTHDGTLIATTHGDHYRYLLDPAASRAYDEGRPVTLDNYTEGRKFYLTFHPPSFMQALLAQHFAEVRHLPSPADGIPQDVWIASAPLRAGAA